MVTGAEESKAVRMRPVVVDLLIFVDPEDFRAEHVDLAIFLEKSSSSQRSIIASLSCCDCASMFFFPSTVPLLRSIHDCLARDNVHLLISSSHPLANQTMQPRIEGRGGKGSECRRRYGVVEERGRSNERLWTLL
jgi:hypothetical protein